MYFLLIKPFYYDIFIYMLKNKPYFFYSALKIIFPLKK